MFRGIVYSTVVKCSAKTRDNLNELRKCSGINYIWNWREFQTPNYKKKLEYHEENMYIFLGLEIIY